MANIVTHAWAAQPQSLPQVDPVFAINEAWLPHLAPVGLVRGSSPSTEATHDRRTTPEGIGFRVTATGRRYSQDFFNGQSVYGWLLVAHRDGSANTVGNLFRKNGVCIPAQEYSTDNVVRAAVWPGGTLRNNAYSHASGTAISFYYNKTTVFAGRADAAGVTLYTCIDGVITTSTITSGAGTLASNTTPLIFGAAEDGSEVASPWSYLLALQWQGSIPSDQQLRVLMRERWRTFAPRRIWIPAAASAPATPTLSAATYVPGSITSSGFTPRVTVTF